MTTAMQNSCLSDDQFLSYNEGRLSPSDKAAVEAHFKGCEPCKVRNADVQFWDGFMREHVEWSPEDIGAE
jgi:anti-sigma factor RsiW